MEPGDIPRVTDPADPKRCQWVMPHGQCLNVAVDGSKFCYPHMGAFAVKAQEKKAANMYRLARFKAKIDQKLDSPNLKSLREEIAILRMVLEEIINRCADEQDLVMASARISDMIMKINKVVTSCNGLEKAMSSMLDKSAILQYASTIVTIIDEEVQDKDTVKRVADRMITALGEMQNAT